MNTNESFVRLVIYPSTPDGQVGQADALLHLATTTIRTVPGLVACRLFVSEDGDSVVSLVEWRDRGPFTPQRHRDCGRAAARAADALRPRPYWLRPYAIVEPDAVDRDRVVTVSR